MVKLQVGCNDLQTTNPKLASQWHPIKNGDLKPINVTAGSNKKVWWLCENGHEWQAVICSRNVGIGCPICSGKKVLSGYNDFATTHPAYAKLWHPSKNGDILPSCIKAGSQKKYWWQCDKGHEWQASVNHISKGHGCPICSGRQVLKGVNDLATVNPELAKEWHPTKNGNLKPNDFLPNSGKKVWWICDKGHEWQASLNNRTRNKGTGCPVCANKKIAYQKAFPLGNHSLATENPELSKQWHPTKNGNLRPENVMPGSEKMIWWVCSKGHEWKAKVYHRYNGSGCPICAGQKLLPGYNDLLTLHPGLASEWHPTKNGSLTPSDVLAGSTIKVWWQCKNGHEWQSQVGERYRGSGCPDCNKERKTSFNEMAVYYYAKQIFPSTISGDRIVLDGLESDIYIPEANTIIEYDGVHWHNHKKGKDEQKNIIAQHKGITLFRIREPELPELSGCECVCMQDFRPQSIDACITEILGKIVPYDRKCVDVDTVRDRADIWSLYIICEKENSLQSNNPQLASEWHPKKNGKLKPENIAQKSGKIVWWQCDKGHEWQDTVLHRSQGRGCPVCSGHRVLSGFNDLATLRPEIAKQWDYNKNNELTPEQVSIGSGKKVWWLCQDEHSWQARISERVKGQNCPYCSGHRVLAGFNDLATARPDLAAQWHPTKNGQLSPQSVTPNSGKNVWWICREGHEWEARVSDRNNGKGCPACYHNKRSRKS